MRLIGLAVLLTLSVTLAPLAVEAQQPGKVPRIGMLLSGALVDSDPRVAALRQALRERGYVDGQNIAIEPRGSDDIPRLDELATDLVRSKVDVIVTQGTPGTQAAARATRTTSIVMAASGDAVKLGLVTSLARPGGNITGQTIIAAEYIGKRLEILREIVPSVSRIAILWNPANPGLVDQMESAEDAARTLGVALQRVEARRPDELERAFQASRNGRAGALLVTDDAVFSTHRARIVSLAEASRLPTIYGLRTAEAGGLVSYGPNLLEMFRSAAIYVVKILKGAKPADLPIEQPTKFELVINLKTAKALGLTIPQSLLLRADQVIQ
jgi:putative tryptophan/tyrosine transport system substrate-binding protein